MTTKKLLDFLHQMKRIRMTEEALASKYAEQQMRCPMHLCIGQEAIAVGVCSALKKNDFVYSNHRAHGHYLAKGGNLLKMISEIYGKDIGCSGGRGGSMHIIDLDVGFMGSTPIVGGTVPIAVGNAWASKILKDRKVTVAFFGDGCFEEGVVHESFNFASLHKLPIIFVCENNNYSVYTKLDDRQPNRPIYKVAESHNILSYSADGNNVLEVSDISEKSVNHCRNKKGPVFLEFSTYRWREHCGPNYDDDLNYRNKQEISIGKANCPIKKLENLLLSKNLLANSQLEKMIKKIQIEIYQAFEISVNAKYPSLSSAKKFLYANS